MKKEKILTEFYDLTPDQQIERLEKMARKALASWDIPEDSRIELLKYRENAVFKVIDSRDGTKYAMRLHRPGFHSDVEIASEIQWMQALNKAGFQTPKVVPNSSGENMTIIDHTDLPEPRQVDVFHWVNGSQLGTIENTHETPADTIFQNYFKIGKIASGIHNHGENWVLPANFKRKPCDEDGLLGENALLGNYRKLERLSKTQLDILAKAELKMRAKLKKYGKTPDRYGLCHGDFLQENFLVDGNDITLIDFNECGPGWYAMEMATSLFFLNGEEFYSTSLVAMTTGYQSERDLPPEFLEMLPTFTLARGVSYLGWLHTRRDTETAIELTDLVVEMVMDLAINYLEDK